MRGSSGFLDGGFGFSTGSCFARAAGPASNDGCDEKDDYIRDNFTEDFHYKHPPSGCGFT